MVAEPGPRWRWFDGQCSALPRSGQWGRLEIRSTEQGGSAELHLHLVHREPEFQGGGGYARSTDNGLWSVACKPGLGLRARIDACGPRARTTLHDHALRGSDAAHRLGSCHFFRERWSGEQREYRDTIRTGVEQRSDLGHLLPQPLRWISVLVDWRRPLLSPDPSGRHCWMGSPIRSSMRMPPGFQWGEVYPPRPREMWAPSRSAGRHREAVHSS